MTSRGREVWGEVVSADASGAVAFTLYTMGEDAQAVTLGETEYLHITDVDLVVAAAGVAGIYTITVAAGERIVCGTWAASGGISRSYNTPHTCPRGVVPVVIGVAGVVHAVIHGFITNA